jgi:sporulation protein YlmC with PRC-barrel domain
MTGPEMHATLQLLDHQIVEKRTGRMVAKVDDIELDMSGEFPVVAALLTGPAALGPRIPGLLGRFIVSVYQRLHPEAQPGPNRIPAGLIVEIESAVAIDSADHLHVQGFGRWVDEQIISRIPGADDAP